MYAASWLAMGVILRPWKRHFPLPAPPSGSEPCAAPLTPRPRAREEELVLLKLLPRPRALAGSSPGSSLAISLPSGCQGEGWGHVPIGGVQAQPSLMLSHQEGRECHMGAPGSCSSLFLLLAQLKGRFGRQQNSNPSAFPERT